MKLSTKGRYGLRAMIDIAVYSEKEPVPICKIAERQSLSERYLEQLMSLLRKNGLIRSVRGAGGGYVLAGGGKILGALPLRVGGLMSTAPWEEIQAGAGAILERAKAMGIPYHVDPFTSLSFLALPVIPELRLTDRGLFDVTAFSLVKD